MEIEQLKIVLWGFWVADLTHKLYKKFIIECCYGIAVLFL